MPPPPRRASFWDRITEGSSLGQLWTQLKNDSLLSYRLYARDSEAQRALLATRGRHGKKSTIKAFFWAIMTKLSPAKRVVLLAALVLIIFPQFNYNGASVDFSGIGILLLFGLLFLEIADRVTLKRDLEIAREIQLWLLPTQPPTVDGAELAFFNRPANTVSGDLYDAFGRGGEGGDRLVLTVADVAGKGVPAALLMATYQAGLRALCAGQATLAAIASGLNRQAIAHSVGGERFTTAFIGEYDPERKTLNYVNAGHNPPLLCREGDSAGRRIEPLTTGGPPLGILPDVEYTSGSAALASGDAVFVYSDGLTEATAPDGQEYGESRLRAVLARQNGGAAGELVRAVLSDFDRYTANTPRQDDVTCLVLKRT